MLGYSHEDTLKSSGAISIVKGELIRYSSDRNTPAENETIKVESTNKSMAVKDLIELIDQRKLNRVGLNEKSDLVQLLEESNNDACNTDNTCHTEMRPLLMHKY